MRPLGGARGEMGSSVLHVHFGIFFVEIGLPHLVNFSLFWGRHITGAARCHEQTRRRRRRWRAGAGAAALALAEAGGAASMTAADFFFSEAVRFGPVPAVVRGSFVHLRERGK